MKQQLSAIVRFTAAMIGVSIIAPTAYAESQTTGHLVRIGTGWGGEGLYLTLDQPTTPACSSGMLFMPTTAAQYKETYAMALEALSLGLAITVYYTPTCNGASMSIDAVSVSP